MRTSSAVLFAALLALFAVATANDAIHVVDDLEVSEEQPAFAEEEIDDAPTYGEADDEFRDLEARLTDDEESSSAASSSAKSSSGAKSAGSSSGSSKSAPKAAATSAATTAAAPAATAAATAAATPSEDAKLEATCSDLDSQIDRARQEPDYFINKLKPYTDAARWSQHGACAGQSLTGSPVSTPNCLYTSTHGVKYLTHDGAAGIEAAIKFLEEQKANNKKTPMPKLTQEGGMCKATCLFVKEQGAFGDIGHVGPTGSSTLSRAHQFGDWDSDITEIVQYGSFLGDGVADDVVMQLIVGDGDLQKQHRQLIFNPKWKSVGACMGYHKSYEHMATVLLSAGWTDHGKAKAAKPAAPAATEAPKATSAAKTEAPKATSAAKTEAAKATSAAKTEAQATSAAKAAEATAQGTTAAAPKATTKSSAQDEELMEDDDSFDDDITM